MSAIFKADSVPCPRGHVNQFIRPIRAGTSRSGRACLACHRARPRKPKAVFAPRSLNEWMADPAYRAIIMDRLWAQVTKTEGCWLWTGGRGNHGYGELTIGGKWAGALSVLAVHRLVYTDTFGPIPDGLFVCHHCDVRPCVRPHHLFVGSNRDNSLDMVAKGRAPMTGAKLTAEQVYEIRRSTETAGALARRFGTSAQNVRAIRRGDTWRML